MQKIRVAIIGATGYVGIELVRLALSHPYIQLKYVVSENHSGEMLAEVYPHLSNVTCLELTRLDLESIAADIDIALLALPHSLSLDITAQLIDYGKRIIDLSADLRLNNGHTYQKWYKTEAAKDYILKKAVYGLPEIIGHEPIANAQIIANPGCYPTASILAIAPALKAKLVNPKRIIIDAKSGLSGAGRTLQLGTNYCEVSENFAAYAIAGSHRHTPEIEQELSKIAQTELTIQFTPHLSPMLRGLMATIYLEPIGITNLKDIIDYYSEFYRDCIFVRINNSNIKPQTKQVRCSNYCDINLYHDPRTNNLIIISLIDNLIKGASGQALQNFNIMYNLPETTGLMQIVSYP